MDIHFDISDFVQTRTIGSVTSDLVDRVIARRKESKVSQMKLSELSGVSFASIRRFEKSGEISLASLLKIANALGYLEDFDLLFKNEKIINLKDYANDK